MMMVDARISLGPLVKTKTGLTPAVIQPRATKPNLPHTSVTAASTTTTTQAAKKVQSSTTSSVSVSQRSGMGVPSAARARNKAQGQSKLSSKPALGTRSQKSSKSHLSSGLKSTSTSLKSTAASLRPAGRGAANKSAGQPANGSTKTGTETKGRENGRPLKAAFQTSSRPTNRCASRPVGGLMQPAVTEMGKKTKITKETAGKTKNRSSKAPPPKAGVKSRSAALVSQTVPPPARTVSLTGKATDTKTPKVQVRVIPQTEGKKPTAAQVERMKKLQEWREAKGISYKRPPMEVKHQTRRTVSMPQPFWASMNEEDEADSLICAVDRSLADCIKLLREGCPPEQVKEVLSRLPVVSQKFSKYWICRARLMEQEGNLDVLPMFEEAVVETNKVETLCRVIYSVCTTGHFSCEVIINYSLSSCSGPPSQRRESVKVNGHEVRFFTPVRRSVRIERASLRYPTPLQDHDLCVKSYNDLLREDEKERSEEQTGGEPSPSNSSPPVYVYRENEALKDKVFVQLVCDDTD
uniref:Cytoskeleton-associated protein 2 C-terminal domain-containing protein n=1 Tax=Amphilophus citrinellus TaxID=61819 RepID=A0A3Q0S7Q0_AMPCI